VNAEFSTGWVEPGCHGYHPHAGVDANGPHMPAVGIRAAIKWHPWQPGSTHRVKVAVQP